MRNQKLAMVIAASGLTASFACAQSELQWNEIAERLVSRMSLQARNGRMAVSSKCCET